jgi:N,N'-diacetylbacillosaminyl-diphospho-undecaprenol alpha-1,3-N-acetylgalactosaminyltransferase
MRIALVCPDGISILLFCKGIIRALQTVPGAEVIVVSDAGEYGPAIEALGAKSVSVPIARWVNPVEDWRYYRRLAEVFRRERCDVVLNFSTKANIYGSLAAKKAGVPLILSHVVGLGGAFLPPRSLRDRLLQRVALLLYRRALRASRKVWFTNGNDRAFFISHGIVTPEQTVLTRNYLDVSEYARSAVPEADVARVRVELGLTPADQIVVMVARMIWPKGVREFAEAAEQLKASRPNLHFLLVAPLETGSPDAVPESYVREKERVSNLRWLGFRRDVKTIYALSDIAVLPSFYKEGGYPRALLEPMSMGNPRSSS